jgi:hypothetical protein
MSISRNLDVVGICGVIGAGKDTVGQMFVDAGYKKVSFAHALKDIVARLFGWNRNMVEGVTPQARDLREKKDEYWSDVFGRKITPRHILQIFGTEVFKDNVHQDFWVKIVEREIMQGKHGNKIVITDVRFPNEVQLIRRFMGQVYRVVRGPCPQWEQMLLDGVPEEDIPDLPPHKSEYKWIGWQDDIIPNNGTKEELKEYVVAKFDLPNPDVFTFRIFKAKLVDSVLKQKTFIAEHKFPQNGIVIDLINDIRKKLQLSPQCKFYTCKAKDICEEEYVCRLLMLLGVSMSICVVDE